MESALCVRVLALALTLAGTTSYAQVDAQTVATSTSTSTSNTTPNPWCEWSYKLYDPVELTFVVIVGGPRDCEVTVPGVRVNDLGHRVVVDQFPPDAHGPMTLLQCGSEFHHSEATPDLEDFDAVSLEVYDSSGALSEIVALCPERLECWPWDSGPDGPRLAAVCGDPDWSGSIGVRDALIALRAAVSIEPCAVTLCDADRDGSVKTTDAMLILLAGVGLDVPLICPAPCDFPAEGAATGESMLPQSATRW